MIFKYIIIQVALLLTFVEVMDHGERLVFAIGDNNKVGKETTVNSMTQ
jgi:hypothetical protein